jgi:transcriptional regulator with XRE-family HTH domain
MGCVVRPFGETLLGLIEASRYGSQRQFAIAIGMEPTYLNRIVKGYVQRPDPETLARMAEALGLPYAELAKLAGYPSPGAGNGGGNGEPPAPPAEEVDRAFDPAAIVAYVEAKPDPQHRAQLARQKARRTPESYTRLCLRINRAWTSNADLVLGELEEVEQG